MKTTRLEQELILLEDIRQSRGQGIHTTAADMLINAYIRERRWTVAFFASVLANVVLFAEVFM